MCVCVCVCVCVCTEVLSRSVQSLIYDVVSLCTNYQSVFMRDGSEQVVAGTLSTVGTESAGVVSGFMNCNQRNVSCYDSQNVKFYD